MPPSAGNLNRGAWPTDLDGLASPASARRSATTQRNGFRGLATRCWCPSVPQNRPRDGPCSPLVQALAAPTRSVEWWLPTAAHALASRARTAQVTTQPAIHANDGPQLGQDTFLEVDQPFTPPMPFDSQRRAARPAPMLSSAHDRVAAVAVATASFNSKDEYLSRRPDSCGGAS